MRLCFARQMNKVDFTRGNTNRSLILCFPQRIRVIFFSIRETNPICPALVKFPPFRIVGLARRQPCFPLTHRKNENFPMCRVAEFPQSKFFVRQGKSADNPDGLTSILTQDCGTFACGNHMGFDSLMLMRRRRASPLPEPFFWLPAPARHSSYQCKLSAHRPQAF